MEKYIDGNVNSEYFIFQDIANPRLTWRLYDQVSRKLILKGFYQNNSQFSISHSYGEGLGDTLETGLTLVFDKLKRTLSRYSRDIDQFIDEGTPDAAKDWLAERVGDVDEALRSLNLLGDNNWLEKLRNMMSEWSIRDSMNQSLNSSELISQGRASKLYEGTSIQIPAISKLETIIWSTPPSNSCVEKIIQLNKDYFLGEFEYEGDTGRWNAPNKLDIALDNPLDMLQEVQGTFLLRCGPYVYRNLLLKGVSWDFSKEFMAYPQKSGDKPVVTNIPAYAVLTLDLDMYKYNTDKYLEATWAPAMAGDPAEDIENNIPASSKYSDY